MGADNHCLEDSEEVWIHYVVFGNEFIGSGNIGRRDKC